MNKTLSPVSLCVLVILALCFAGCHQRINHGGRTPLVEVAGQVLYTDDLDRVMPVGISSDDSVLFAENYVRNWIEDALLQHKAQRNVANDPEVEALVAAYRRALVLHLYQQRLIDQRLMSDITSVQVDSFYQENINQFLLEKPLVKGLYIKVPLKDAGVKNVRQWYTQREDEVLELLEKYSLQHAADYLYFYDKWIPLEDVLEKMPLTVSNPVKYVKSNPHLELKDTAFYHFLHVDSVLTVGEPMPLDYAEGEIRGMLMNIKRVDFMRQVRNELYEDALEKNNIIYY